MDDENNMIKKIKIQSPKIPRELEKAVDIIDEILEEEKIEEKIIENIIIQGISNLRVRFSSCIFRNVTFEECDFRKIDMVDVIFENCNLSNINFGDSGIYRVEFINCKLTGARFDDSILKSTVFKSSRGLYSNFSFSKFKGVSFMDSEFQNSVFQEVHNETLIVESTDLSKSIFSGISLNGVDFSTCNIEGIEIQLKDVCGGKFTVVQALELTKLMGITIV